MCVCVCVCVCECLCVCVCEDQYICDFNEREILAVKYTFWQKVIVSHRVSLLMNLVLFWI